MDAIDAARRRKWGCRVWEIIAGVIVGVVLAMAVGGCASASRDAQRRLAEVTRRTALIAQEHQNARQSLDAARATDGMPEPAIVHLDAVVGHLDAADGHNSAIGDSARRAQTDLAGVEDRKGVIGEFFGEAGVIIKLVLGTVVVVALALIGLWAVRRFGFLLPRAKREEAVMARAVLDDGDDTTVREYVAMRRATDKQFNAAMGKAKPRPPPAA